MNSGNGSTVREEARQFKAHGTSISLGFDFCAEYLDPLRDERRRQTGNAKVSRSDIARELIVFGSKYRKSLYLLNSPE